MSAEEGGENRRLDAPTSNRTEGAVTSGNELLAESGNELKNAADQDKARDESRSHPHAVSIRSLAALAGAFLLGAGVTLAFLSTPLKQQRRPTPMPGSAHPLPLVSPPRLPPGHPALQSAMGHAGAAGASQMDAVVIQAEKQARQKPSDIAVWNRYGDLAMRFAAFNPADYQRSRDAYAHVLDLDPHNREALRGIANIHFDLRQYASAINAYHRYLREQPDDSRAHTDLGTMYLSEHNIGLAIKEYRAALSLKSDFFPAQFNLAVAYLWQKDYAQAREALQKARASAPDPAARNRIDDMIATVDRNVPAIHAKEDAGAGSKTARVENLPQ